MSSLPSDIWRNYTEKLPFANHSGFDVKTTDLNQIEACNTAKSLIDAVQMRYGDHPLSINSYASHDPRRAVSFRNIHQQSPVVAAIADTSVNIAPNYTGFSKEVQQQFNIAAKQIYNEMTYRPSHNITDGVLRQVNQGEFYFDPVTKSILTPSEDGVLVVPQKAIEYSARVLQHVAKTSAKVKQIKPRQVRNPNQIVSRHISVPTFYTNTNGAVQLWQETTLRTGLSKDIRKEELLCNKLTKEFYTLGSSRMIGPDLVVKIDEQMFNKCNGYIYCNTFKRFVGIGDELLFTDFVLSVDANKNALTIQKRNQTRAFNGDVAALRMQIEKEIMGDGPIPSDCINYFTGTYNDDYLEHLRKKEEVEAIFSGKGIPIHYSDVLKDKIRVFRARTTLDDDKLKIVIDGVTKREMTKNESQSFNGYQHVFAEHYTGPLPANSLIMPINEFKVMEYDLDKTVEVNVFNSEGKLNFVDPVKDEQIIFTPMLSPLETNKVLSYSIDATDDTEVLIGREADKKAVMPTLAMIASVVCNKELDHASIPEVANFSNKNFPFMIDEHSRFNNGIGKKRGTQVLGPKEVRYLKSCKTLKDVIDGNCNPVSPLSDPVCVVKKPKSIVPKPHDGQYRTEKFKKCRSRDTGFSEVTNIYNTVMPSTEVIRYEMVKSTEPTAEIVKEMLAPDYLSHLDKIKENFASIGCPEFPIIIKANMKFEVCNGSSGRYGSNVNYIDYLHVANNVKRIHVREHIPMTMAKCSDNIVVDGRWYVPLSDKEIDYSVEYVKDQYARNAVVYKYPMGPYPVTFIVEKKTEWKDDVGAEYRYIDFEGEILEINVTSPRVGFIYNDFIPQNIRTDQIVPFEDGHIERLYTEMERTDAILFSSLALKKPPTPEQIAECMELSCSESSASEDVERTLLFDDDDLEDGDEARSHASEDCESEDYELSDDGTAVIECVDNYADNFDIDGHSCTLLPEEEERRRPLMPHPYPEPWTCEFNYSSYAELMAYVCGRKNIKIGRYECEGTVGSRDKHTPFVPFYDINRMLTDVYGREIISAHCVRGVCEDLFYDRVKEIAEMSPLSREIDMTNIIFLSRKRQNCPSNCWYYTEARKRFFEKHQPAWWDKYMSFTDDSVAAAFFFMQYPHCVTIDKDLLPGGFQLITNSNNETVLDKEFKCEKPDKYTYLMYIDPKFTRVNYEVAYYVHYWKEWCYMPSEYAEYSPLEIQYREMMWKLIFKRIDYVDYNLHPECHPVLTREILDEKTLTSALYVEAMDMLDDPEVKKNRYKYKEMKEDVRLYKDTLDAVILLVQENNMYYELFMRPKERRSKLVEPRMKDPYDEMDMQREDVRSKFMKDRIIVTNCYSLLTVRLMVYFVTVSQHLAEYKKIEPSELECVHWSVAVDHADFYNEFQATEAFLFHPQDEIEITCEMLPFYIAEVEFHTGWSWDEYINATGFDEPTEDDVEIVHKCKRGYEVFTEFDEAVEIYKNMSKFRLRKHFKHIVPEKYLRVSAPEGEYSVYLSDSESDEDDEGVDIDEKLGRRGEILFDNGEELEYHYIGNRYIYYYYTPMLKEYSSVAQFQATFENTPNVVEIIKKGDLV